MKFKFVAALLFFGNFPLIAAEPSDEEFVGPFPSWLDAKRDFGAAGDGKADDTTALQRAFDEMREHKKASVLFIPAGTYRITETIKTARKAHTDNMVSVIGEDPATTTIKWDGPEKGTVLQWDAWYAKLSRLTLDGTGKADVCLQYGPKFSTYNETSDIVCKDGKTGILLGGPGTAGQAENEVLRCQFLRCETGVMTVNWNSMDIWVWYCRFEDCTRGIHNVMGNWHAWENLFLRSKKSDVSINNLMAFSVVNNTSVGSNRFLDFSSGHTWGAPTSITGNRVLDNTGDWAMVLDNAGPYLVVDNTMRLGEKSRGIRMTWADQTFVGNVYSKEKAVEERGRFRRIDEKVVSAKEIPDALPAMPSVPPHRDRKVFDLPTTADAAAIQQALDEAAKLSGQRPVVHLPMGEYKINRTLVIAKGSDVQLVGDGASEVSTRLVWRGAGDGVVLKIEGPSKAALRDFQIQGGGARALLVEDPDQDGGRIFADQLNTNGPANQKAGRTAALRVSGFEHTPVEFRALQGSGNGGAWVEVLGSGNAGQADLSPPAPLPQGERGEQRPFVTVFTGATGSAAGQYDVKQNGRLVVRAVYHEKSADALNGLHLTDSGILSIDATRFSYATSEKAPTVAADDFRGMFTLGTCMLMPVDSKETCRFELRGDGSHASVLALNNQFWVQKPGSTAETIWLNKAQPPAHGGLIGSNINTSNKDAAPKGFEFLHNIGDNPDPAKSKFGSGPLEDKGGVDDATIVKHLAPLRSARPWLPNSTPAGKTDFRIQRVICNGGFGVVEIRAVK
ncbi:MAG TPA: glycosyl hydrolase family 28-related protein [Planctomycetota bacterium]|nr:glycosyl hydrolase family 28-related protein [Planctomycetota bacterium]